MKGECLPHCTFDWLHLVSQVITSSKGPIFVYCSSIESLALITLFYSGSLVSVTTSARINVPGRTTKPLCCLKQHSQCSLNCFTHVLVKGINSHTMHHLSTNGRRGIEAYVTYDSSGRDTVRTARISDWMKGWVHEAKDPVESSI
jgi:hypothetical protein